MKQIVQHLKSGKTEAIDVPVPSLESGHLLIRTNRTLISPGTERMLLQFGRAGLIGKARQQPEKVKQAINKIRTDGIGATAEAISSKLDKPVPLGYCNVGRVVEVGSGVEKFSVGDRVVSNGPHAELVSVPINLCAKVPDDVTDDEAVFTVIGSIALHSVRLCQPTLGEKFCVMGLGLVGLLTAQILMANGCRVIASDFDPERLKIAKSLGISVVDLSQSEEDLIKSCDQFTQGRGIDGVVIAAHTKSNQLIKDATLMCRKRGRLVLVGLSGLEFSKTDFYEKELSFQVSCSYGPGRYDSNYEEKGNDYPIAYVRWTEQRNFQAILELIRDKKIITERLITHKFEFSQTKKIYDIIDGGEGSLGVLLEFPDRNFDLKTAIVLTESIETEKKGESDKNNLCLPLKVAVFGAGDYARKVLVPALKRTSLILDTIVGQKGVNSVSVAEKYGFNKVTNDGSYVFDDSSVEAVFIATRHNSHAKLIKSSMESGKHIYVEKPMCINPKELEMISKQYESFNKVLMVGFNRRFSPLILKVKSLLKTERVQKAFLMTVNAGAIPREHWLQNPEIGGGRIVGEMCHFVDLIRFLAGYPIQSYTVLPMKSELPDNVSVSLRFRDGSIGVINYFSNGDRSYPKETIEIFSGGKILKLDNFRKLHGYGWKNFKKKSLWRQDKGNKACVHRFAEAITKNQASPIPFDELVEVAKITIGIAEAIN